MTCTDYSDVKLTKRCVSITQLESYHRCPRQWYLKHYLKLYIPVPVAPWLLLGRDIHHILEVYNKTGNLDLSKLESLDPEKRSQCTAALMDYLKHYAISPGKSDWVEWGYNYSLRELGYNTQDEGKIDIIGTPQGLDFLVIADYKVVSDLGGYEKPGETLQLGRYHHIVKESLGLDIPWVGYVFIDYKNSRSIVTYGKVTQQAIDLFYTYLNALMEGVRNRDYPKTKEPEKSCLFCEFATLCGRDKEVVWHLTKNNIKGRTLKMVASLEWLVEDEVVKDDVCNLL